MPERHDELQRENRSIFDPASAPMVATSAVAIVYQVATNSGESSVQCDAYNVAANPADSMPAIAPATAGRVGAPARKPINAAARNGSDISVIAAMQTRELLPIRRVIIGNRCGIIISLPIANARIAAGISSNHPHLLSEASGRDKCRLTATAEIAIASVTTNFISKNGLCIAVMTSGRTPSPAKNIATEIGAADSNAIVSAKLTGRVRCALSAARVRMSCSVSILISPAVWRGGWRARDAAPRAPHLRSSLISRPYP